MDDIIWRLENPDIVSETIDSFVLMWIDEYISVWKEELEKMKAEKKDE